MNINLEKIKQAGIYTVDGDLEKIEQDGPWYYTFYIDVRSCGDRLKNIINKRIEQDSVWLLIDDSRIINRVLLTVK